MKKPVSRIMSMTVLTLAALWGNGTVAQAQTQAEQAPQAPQAAPNLTVQGSANQTGTETPSLDAYMLGAGDQISIITFGAEEYSSETLVLPDGSLSLPVAGTVMVGGMTLRQAADAIATQYSTYIKRPVVTVSLIEMRPMRVGIAGQVNRPGTYNLSSGEEAAQFPTVTEALQIAGGITPKADLRQVQVQRVQRDGSRQTINVNLWDLLMTGDLGKDVILHAGDSIFIPTATAVNPSEAVQLGAASFSPESIPVYVVGEVMTPGMVEVPPNTPMNQALMAAGGFNLRRARTGEVKLVRLNPDGTVSQSEVEIDLSQGAESASNPPLQRGDVIVVGRSGLASFSDATEDTLGPLGRIVSGILGLFPLFR
ncbi:SLBB domain-containing protein [Leptolyngbya sp. ST-U4]|uniref:SLBB domain-containing protein n=1 Tax=Leptolyngbya sp. ST-U4 TaxID=2933912 RepID=UPI001986A970|nr:SLBB domain-containing protein [Cyanobacteria bacterium FACHB-502]